MMQYSLRRAVMAARSVSREVIKPVPATPSPEPPSPPPRDWLVVARQEQHNDHMFTYWGSQFAKLAPARFESIRRAVCAQFGVSRLEILSHRRAQRISRARMACVYLAKNLTSYSLPEIGRLAGGFDHSTVIHAVKRVASLRTTDPEFDAAIGAVEWALQQGEVINVSP